MKLRAGRASYESFTLAHVFKAMKQLTHFKNTVNAAGINGDACGVRSNSFAVDAAQGLADIGLAATSGSNNSALGSDHATGLQFEPQGPNH